MAGKLAGRRAGLALACVLLSGIAGAQVVKAPRYTGGFDAPTPALNLPALPPAITPGGTIVEDVVARVNDQIISRSDVARSEEQLQQEARERQYPASEVASLQRDMLRDMIDQQLLLSRAKELGFNADADVIRQLDELRKQNKMESLDDLERAARTQGVNFEDFKAKIRNQVLTQQVIRDEVGRRLQLSPSDVAKYYDAHQSEFIQPEQIRLSEILVPLPENATPAEIVQAEKKANGLKTQVMQGGDFTALAKANSGGPSASQGGELGLFKRGALAQVLEDQTFPLKIGDSTQPIRTRQGYVILKVTEHQAAGPAPLKDVEPQIQEALYTQAMQPAMRAYLTKLREEAYVDIQAGFVDSGASSRETKPVFTAYAPPPVKKKVVKEKARFDRGGRYTPVVASPDTTGGRTLTGRDAAPTPVDPGTGLAVIRQPSKPSGRIKREKVRFGQAPRTPLPAGSDDVAGGDAARSATPAPTAVPSNTLGSLSGGTGNTADSEDNPLNVRAPEQKKSRFASRSREYEASKTKTLSSRQVEKTKAAPIAESTEDRAANRTQAAPLGLNGDTSQKPKKAPRPAGAPKGRLEDKKKEAPVEVVPVAPTANPALAPTSNTPPTTPSPAPETTPPPPPTPPQT